MNNYGMKILIFIAIAFLFTGCGFKEVWNQVPSNEFEKESAAESVGETSAEAVTEETQETVKDATEETQETAKDATEETQETAKDATEPAQETTEAVTESSEVLVETNIATAIESILPEKANWLDPSALPSAERDIVFSGVDAAKAREIDAVLDSFEPDISLAVYSIDGTKGIFYNTEQKYFSACTIKIGRMMYLCRAIDAGLYDKEMVMTYEERHYHQGSGKIRKGNFGDTYTLENLIHLCMSLSDNVAYKMLMEIIDGEAYTQYANELGYKTFQTKATSMWSSRSQVKDYIGVWNEAYQYFQEETTGAAILKKACTNTYFAYGVRTMKDCDYSHKSGDNFGASCAYHDAGIVWAETPYLYAIFSKCEGEDENVEKIDGAMTMVHELLGGNVLK